MENNRSPIKNIDTPFKKEAPDKPRVALYARKSREDEEHGEASLDTQITILTSLAEKDGHENYDLYQEIDSSIKIDRPQLTKMLRNIEQYDIIYCAHIDRLGRDIGILDDIKKLCLEHDVIIKTPDNEITFKNDDEQLLYGFTSVLSDFEYRRIRRRLLEGKLNAVKYDRKFVMPTPPYGYEVDPETQTLVPSSTETLDGYRLIIDMALKNYSQGEIADALNERGYRTQRGKEFTNASVRKILSSRTYLGELRYKSSAVEEEVHLTDTHEPLISEEDFNRIQKLTKNRAHQTKVKSVGTKTTLDGLLRCPVCKYYYTIVRPKSRYVEGGFENARTHKCRYPHKETGVLCNNKGFRVFLVEEQIFKLLDQKSDEILEELKNLEEGNSDEVIAVLQDRLDGISSQIKQKHSALTRLLDVYLDGDIPKDTYKNRKDSLERQINVLESDYEALSKEVTDKDTSNVVSELSETLDVIETIKTAPLEEQNRLMRTIIKYIDVYVDQDKNMSIEVNWM